MPNISNHLSTKAEAYCSKFGKNAGAQTALLGASGVCG
jgi:hypothetical protein